MKASIDMKQPKSYPHVQFNAKRMQMEAERNSAIGTHAKTHLLWGGRTDTALGQCQRLHPLPPAAPPACRACVCLALAWDAALPDADPPGASAS